ncbi:MAG: cytochrome D1 domain-containing protein [Iamia sp.]
MGRVLIPRQKGAPYTQRRLAAAVAVTAVLLGAGTGVNRLAAGDRPTPVSSASPTSRPEVTIAVADGGTTAPATDPATTAPATSVPATSVPSAPVPSAPSATTTMTLRERITGDISPKSVAASGHGLVSAQNMMYTHTMTVYESDGTLAATIPDSVVLADFGIPGHPGTSQGAPVETAFTRDGRFAYVSNYSMYGEGFGPEGGDACTPESGTEESFLYRVDTERFEIDQVIPVGAVPKYVAITPDGATVLVTNWCTYDMSVVDVASAQEVARVPIGRYPRGIVVSPDSRTAYVSVMGGSEIMAVDLATRSASVLASVGAGPRHLVISPDGSTVYVTSNDAGTVSAVDTATGAVLDSVSTGTQPRSMAISSDGTALYVVEYESSEVVKLRTEDLATLVAVPTDYHPIGIAYEPTTGAVWVACYGGSIMIFDDGAAA